MFEIWKLYDGYAYADVELSLLSALILYRVSNFRVNMLRTGISNYIFSITDLLFTAIYLVFVYIENLRTSNFKLVKYRADVRSSRDPLIDDRARRVLGRTLTVLGLLSEPGLERLLYLDLLSLRQGDRASSPPAPAWIGLLQRRLGILAGRIFEFVRA